MKRFLPLALTALVLLAGCNSTGLQSGGSVGSASQRFLSTVSWDAEYDVVVIGFGGAGASASVSAADNGAKVLLLEKAPEGEEGGNTRYALQLILTPKDKEAGIAYFTGLRGLYSKETQGDDVIELIVTETMKNQDWLINTMGADPAKITHYLMLEYPELPRAADAVDGIFVEEGFWNSSLWNMLRQNVMNRKDKIDVWFESPATRLIQDPITKIVHGVIVQHEGKTYNVRAKNGVVLATGGFENSDTMLENYAQLSNAYSKGAKYNTGDGIKMGLDVGADLWHMSTLAGPDVNFVNPDTGRAQFYGLQLPAEGYRMTGFMGQAAIFVGGNGTRFTNEVAFPRHGHYNYSGTWFSLLVPNNSWCVFDETARKGNPAYFQWSEGMEEEIAKGWIIKANTLAELAAKMEVPVEAFTAEVNEYNQFCRNQYDPRFKVPAPFLKPIASGPFYAFKINATLTNTQGGPRRNVECEVQNPWGESIPHLYSAGELGSFYCDVYNGGGNLSECLFTGRIAGKNATTVKRDTTQGSVLGSRTPVNFVTAESSYPVGPNQYIGKAMGIGSEIVVRVTYANGVISNIEILKQNETPSIADQALVRVPAAIVTNNSTDVDSVSGATTTSNAIKAAVQQAIAKAN
ncbi:FAD-binding dehydrogenase [Spirochaetia bacterium]|nr:FAD-binding dehydrogenase [Spirochaetia bacterium]